MSDYSDDERNTDPRRVRPMTAALAPVERPRERAIASRIGQVREFRGQAGDITGCCPSCFGSGFLHGRRVEGPGVLYDGRTGALLRCDCPKGLRVRELDEEGRRR